MLGDLPVSLSVAGWWALGGVAVGILLGALFPKVVSCVCYPFANVGIS